MTEDYELQGGPGQRARGDRDSRQGAQAAAALVPTWKGPEPAGEHLVSPAPLHVAGRPAVPRNKQFVDLI